MIYDVIVIGGGSGGMAAALAAADRGSRVLVIEREQRLGGILKQCVHDGFGMMSFGERLTGPEYAERYIKMLVGSSADYITGAFVTDIAKKDGIFALAVTSKEGISLYKGKTIVLATGCRERTARQVFIHGDRPAGIFTAGTAQNLVNLMGVMPTKRCVILGSGDIGLIMARRLTLSGASVEGVYEVKSTPSGLARNISQCLGDFGIPLHLSTTCTRVNGRRRVESVEVARVDENMTPIKGTERTIKCDALILSVGLIPENEVARSLGVELDPKTQGPVVDHRLMTTAEGVFCCGNALMVSDLVDYVSYLGAKAGQQASAYAAEADKVHGEGENIRVKLGEGIAFAVPQQIKRGEKQFELFFRTTGDFKNKTLVAEINGEAAVKKKYRRILPQEMQHIKLEAPKGVEGIRLTMEDN